MNVCFKVHQAVREIRERLALRLANSTIRLLVTVAVLLGLMPGSRLEAAEPPRFAALDLNFKAISGGYRARLNDRSQVIGTLRMQEGGAVWYEAARTRPNQPLSLPEDLLGKGDYVPRPAPLPTFASVAEGINDLGQVVGTAYRVNSSLPGTFLTEPDGKIDANSLRKFDTTAGSVDNFGRLASGPASGNGEITGALWAPDGFLHAKRGSLDRPAGPYEDLGTLGFNSYGLDINNHGVVVGESFVSLEEPGGYTHAFRAIPGQPMQDIDPGGGPSPFGVSSANGINDSGWIVGGSRPHGVTLWIGDESFGLEDLLINPLTDMAGRPTHMGDVFDINNHGQILVRDVDYQLWLLSPVPEPSTLVLGAFGCGALVLFAKKHRVWPAHNLEWPAIEILIHRSTISIHLDQLLHGPIVPPLVTQHPKTSARPKLCDRYHRHLFISFLPSKGQTRVPAHVAGWRPIAPLTIPMIRRCAASGSPGQASTTAASSGSLLPAGSTSRAATAPDSAARKVPCPVFPEESGLGSVPLSSSHSNPFVSQCLAASEARGFRISASGVGFLGYQTRCRSFDRPVEKKR